ncbi:MAG: glycosyltransferase [Patescibacteria group bacterium]
MKKVLIFSLAYFPKHVGGAEVAIKEITERMPDIEFHMVTNRFDATLPKEEKIGNIIVHRIGIVTHNPSMADLKKWPLNFNKPLYQFLAAWKAIRLHRKYHFDAMWAMMAHSTGVPAAIFKMVHPEVGYVLNLQEGDPVDYIEAKMRPVWPLFTRAFTMADIIQPLSTFLAKWARARNFSGPIEIIPNAVAAQHFMQAYSAEELSGARAKLGKTENDVFLVTTSRLVTKNAVDDVIQAIALLPERVHFVIYGTGPDEDMLRTLAKEKKVEHRIHFEGQIGHTEMPLLLKACDIFIRPSRSEGFGASFMEAMAAEMPVIATHEGGISDFLFDERRNPDKPTTGWAVDKDSPKQIADAVRDITARPEKVREVVKNAKDMVLAKYDWDIIARDMKKKVFDHLFKIEHSVKGNTISN